jgi:hypothetical protein
MGEGGRSRGAAQWGRKGRGREAVALPPMREKRGARHGCWWISAHGKGGGGCRDGNLTRGFGLPAGTRPDAHGSGYVF